MSDSPRYVTLRDYLRVLRQHRVSIVLITLLFAGAALAFSARQEKVYSAEASLSFQEATQNSDLFGTPSVPQRSAEQRAAESAEAVNQVDILERVQKALDTELPVGALQGLITTQTEAETNFVVIQARGSTPEFAAALANETAKQVVSSENASERARFADAVKAQERELRGFGSDKALEDRLTRNTLASRISSLKALRDFARPANVVKPAQVPAAPISPKPVRNTLLGALLGLTLGVILAFVRDSLDRRLRASSEIERQMRLPLVGHVSAEALGRPVMPMNGRPALSGPELEAFRILRMNLEFLDVDRPQRSILITSSLPEEGKSTVAASLAYTSALAGKRTLLLECDLRRPALAQRLGARPGPGLTECLTGRTELTHATQFIPVGSALGENGSGVNGSAVDETSMPMTSPAGGKKGLRRLIPGLRRRNSRSAASRYQSPVARDGSSEQPSVTTAAPTEHNGFFFLPAGAPAPRPAETLGSERFRELLAALQADYDLVILDTSPLLAVVDTLALLPHIDSVLVCVRMSRTTRDQVLATKAALDRLPVKPTGVVVTGVHPGEELYYGHYSYAYAYGEHHTV